MSISKHISYKEAVYSRTAQRRDIYNHPENDQADNMRLIAEEVFEPLRAWDDTFGRATNAEMFEFIKQHLDFDQMIWEFGTEENPDWVHVSYVSPEENRKRCLKAYKQNNKTKYKII